MAMSGSLWLLGIDGGGSHTVALLASLDEFGRDGPVVLGRGEGGPSNWQVQGAEPALAAIVEATTRAFADAGISIGPIRAACIGLAGVDRPADRAALESQASVRLQIDLVQAANDGELALAAGSPSGCGIAVISGTGSFAYGRAHDGRTARAGGWGYLFGDEGSGFAIARAGLRAVARAADGRGPATRLASLLFDRLRIDCAESLVPAVYGASMSRAEIAALAPIILQAAEIGDAVAAQIVSDAACELCAAVRAVAHKLDGTPEPIVIAVSGGLFVNDTTLLRAFAAQVQSIGSLRWSIQQVTEPALGAVRLALRLDDRSRAGLVK